MKKKNKTATVKNIRVKKKHVKKTAIEKQNQKRKKKCKKKNEKKLKKKNEKNCPKKKKCFSYSEFTTRFSILLNVFHLCYIFIFFFNIFSYCIPSC